MDLLRKLRRMPLWWWGLAALSTVAAVAVYVRWATDEEPDEDAEEQPRTWIATLH